MKIICDKYEFSMLVRDCQHTETYGDCGYCLISGLCRSGSAGESGIINGVEDLCEVVPEE